MHLKLLKLLLALISCLCEIYILICNINTLMWQILPLITYTANHFIGNRNHCAAFASRLTCCCLRLQLLVLLLLVFLLLALLPAMRQLWHRRQNANTLWTSTADGGNGNARPTTVDTGQQQLATGNLQLLLLASAASCWFWFAVTIQLTPQTVPYYIIVTAHAPSEKWEATAASGLNLSLTVSTVSGETAKLVNICGGLRGR